jgi:8-oxo-dGTP pyrophosphatase MutT (NUDIX family)
MKWEILDSEYVFRSPWITVRKDRVRMPSGVEIPDFYVSEFPDWVNVIAITKDHQFIIEEQYRHGIQRVCYELCAGEIKPGEDPLEAARRELLEETGFAGGTWKHIGDYAPNASGANNICHTFLAEDVERVSGQQLESTEEIIVHLYSAQKVREILEKGLIPEGVMAAPLWEYFANNNNQ